MRIDDPDHGFQIKAAGVWTMCRDGALTGHDLQRASGLSFKASRRAFEKWTQERVANGEKGFDAEVSAADNSEPPPGRMPFTRAELATAICEVAGIGRKADLSNRIKERASHRTPPPKRRETDLGAMQHPWNLGTHGRAVKSCAGGGIAATLACSRCDAAETIRFRQLAGTEAMDRKFIQKGWAVDPARCPDHNRRSHHSAILERDTMSKTSPAAIAAQAKMFSLIQTHFDTDAGCYSSGYSDAKIATECGLAPDLVAGVRAQAFGELREPEELAALARDIEALSGLIDETVAPLKAEVAGLRARLAEARKKFAA